MAELCKRVLLKVSGESLMGSRKFGLDEGVCRHVAGLVKSLKDSGKEVAIVIGAGNIFRGGEWTGIGMGRSYADHIWMLATMINGKVLGHFFEEAGCEPVVMGALECPKVVEFFSQEVASERLSQGHTLIFVGGTGNPFFTTDTAGALRAAEIGADVVLKATKVDGVYDKDPEKHSDAVRYKELSYSRVLADKLNVMDLTAVTLCMENNIPIFVFNIMVDKPIGEIIFNTEYGTLVKGE